MDRRAIHRLCTQCCRGKLQRAFRQFSYFCSDRSPDPAVVKGTHDGAMVRSVVRLESEVEATFTPQSCSYAAFPHVTKAQSSFWAHKGSNPQYVTRFQSGSAPKRGFSSKAGNSAQAPSKLQQYLEFVKLKAAARLESIPKKAYLRSLENVLKTAPELEGNVGDVMKQIDKKYEEVLKKHGDLAKDSRGASHLQVSLVGTRRLGDVLLLINLKGFS